jgi:hypothetical protein
MKTLWWNRRQAAGVVALLALVVVLPSCSRREGPPSSISRFPADLADGSLELSGVYEDGWTAPAASLSLRQPEGRQLLVVRGMVPMVGRNDFQTSLEIRVGDEVVAKKPLGLGEFRAEALVPTGTGKRRIGLVFAPPQRLPSGDGRTVGAHLAFVGFEPLAARKPGSGGEIIGRAAGVRLGSGWHDLETFQSETFRWVNNDAQILVSGTRRGVRRVALTVAAGPGLEGRPFILGVLDASGRQVDAVEVAGRKTVELFLPVEPDQESDYRLHVDGGGRPSPNNDPRILNFRVFLIDGY